MVWYGDIFRAPDQDTSFLWYIEALTAAIRFLQVPYCSSARKYLKSYSNFYCPSLEVAILTAQESLKPEPLIRLDAHESGHGPDDAGCVVDEVLPRDGIKVAGCREV